VYTQTIHAAFGGVVPELAARDHLERIATLVAQALDQAGMTRPDAVAATAGPGLIGAVLVGLSWAKGLAAAWDVPFLGVNHLEGHVLSPMVDSPGLAPPYLSLVVSGGHTALYLVRSEQDIVALAHTIDDAAGEAYDKTARLLGLGWPGGPIVDRLASEGRPDAVLFPRPRAPGLDWSFSGLKTAVRTCVGAADRPSPADICASFQAAVVDVLVDRVVRAVAVTGVQDVALGGGVAANSELRRRISSLPGIRAWLPPKRRCTDNAAMIAYAGRLRLLRGERHPLDLTARASWEVG
jgi:N6-L-threonylcarbamoyladenine synthase